MNAITMELADKIMSNTVWSDLPQKLRSQLHDEPKEYEQRIVFTSLQNQLRYNGNLVEHVLKREKKYYEKLVEYSRIQFLLYPYHLQDKIVPGLQITPFNYYRDMLIHLVRTERSYDCLPNFTAADCLRIFGIGRNQYIEMVNTYKSFLTTAGPDNNDNLFEILYDILPHEPKGNLNFESWYIARPAAILMDDIENSTEEERKLIDRIIDAERSGAKTAHPGLAVGDLDLNVLKQLYCRGLAYIDVPLYEEDRICVPTLEGFVMNRVSGDIRENLLYKIFVSADENTTIRELSECLQVDFTLVAQAASVFCRLGFAYKRSSVPQNGFVTLEDIRSSFLSVGSISELSQQYNSSEDIQASGVVTKNRKKIAFVFDSTVTAYLMMGNLSAGLKPHAVTMFEVGKLSDDSLDAFLSELDNLSTIDEGEAKLYYDHAINLRQAIHFLCEQARSELTDFDGVDLIRGGSLLNLEHDTRVRILHKNYNMIASISTMTYEDRQASSAFWPAHIGPPIPEVHSPWFRLFVSYCAGALSASADTCDTGVLPIMLLARGSRISRLPDCFLNCSRFLLTLWGHDPVVLNAPTLLSTVGNMLVSSAVVVQALDVYPTTRKLYQRYIPLPLSKLLVDCEDIDLVPTFLQSLMHQFDLTSLSGYISVLAPLSEAEDPKPSEPDSVTWNPEYIQSMNPFAVVDPGHLEEETSTAKSVLGDQELLDLMQEKQKIYFLTLHLGLPIFNSALLSAVCERITAESDNLLAPKHRHRLESANKSVIKKVVDFIHGTCLGEWPVPDPLTSPPNTTDSNEEQLPGPWPLPVRSVLCDHGHLLWLP